MVIKNKNTYIVLVIIVLISVTIGYAILNTTININGKSNVSKNTWDVHFDNVIINDGSADATNIPIVENNTTVGFAVELNIPGDFYEFTVDVVNNGTIDAMIESVEKTSNLSEEQQKYLNYIIEYQNTEQITTKQLVKVNDFVRLKVRVEYKKDINLSDLPTIAETLNLGFTVNYVQSDGTGSVVPGHSLIKIVSGDGTSISDEVCIGEECFYVMYSDDDTVTMFSKYNLYVGGEYNKNDNSFSLFGDEKTGKQDLNMKGFVSTNEPFKGVLAFSNTNYWSSIVSSYPSYVYGSNSILYTYVEDYKLYLSTLGVRPVDARLITYEELESLGCNVSGYSCGSAPKWVYSTSYWTGSADDIDHILYVSSNAFVGRYLYDYGFHRGVRPVIVIDKSLL